MFLNTKISVILLVFLKLILSHEMVLKNDSNTSSHKNFCDSLGLSPRILSHEIVLKCFFLMTTVDLAIISILGRNKLQRKRAVQFQSLFTRS